MKYVLLIFKNLKRNLLRTTLTCLATMLLVFIVTLVWTIVWFMGKVTEEKSKDLKAVITERWQIPSQMPFAYATSLSEGAARNPGDVKPLDSMTWQFFGGALSRETRSREDMVFAFAMEPRKLATMMDDLDNLSPEHQRELMENIKKLEANNIKLDRPYSVNESGVGLAFITDPWGTSIEINERPRQ